MKFEIPNAGNAPIAPAIEKKSTPKKQWVYDPEEPLPDNVADCDELADKLWELGDMVNYRVVALHCNKLCGWYRWEVEDQPKTPKIKIRPIVPVAPTIGTPSGTSEEERVKSMWAEGKRICDIGRELGISGNKIRKYIANVI